MLTYEQKKLRLEGIGGSEIAAIAGLNPYATALDVWRAKVQGYEAPVTAPMERGTFLEDGVARWYAHRTGAQLREVGTLQHPTLARVFCTPDRIASLSAERDLSIKVPGPYVREQWGEAGTDEVPMTALLQVQWELIILEARFGIRVADVAAPIDGDLSVYPLVADADIQGRLVEIGQKFWRDHVETKTPPPVDGSESSTRWLAEQFPENRLPLRVATPEAESLMRKLFEARMAKAKSELEEEAAKNALKAILADAEGMQGNGWKVTWKTTKGSAKTDWEALAKEIGAPQELIQKFTRTTNGSRRFVPTWKES
jgi:putative phage-type endonuclease